jgi:acyl carrier protein
MGETMSRDDILAQFGSLLDRRGLTGDYTPETQLSDIGFRSLDFSELSIRIEEQHGQDLNFDAALLRRIETVDDVIRFFEVATTP